MSPSTPVTTPLGRRLFDVISALILIAVNAWIAGGVFELIPREGRAPEFVLVTPSFLFLGGAIAAAALVIFVLQAIAGGQAPIAGWRAPIAGGRSTAHLRPVWWLALSLAPLLMLAKPIGGLEPFWYVLVDLRWYWWALVGAEMVRRAASPRSSPVWTRSTALIVGTLVVIPPVVAIVTTPRLRFSGALHGDEPKYMRYVENFYQGRGFNTANKPLMAEASGPTYPRVLQNFRLLASAIPEELWRLMQETRHAITGGGSPRLVGEQEKGGMVFAGKLPGTIYQLHNPGLSFLLVPAYVRDRSARSGSGGPAPGYGGEFPAEMPAVHATLLALFAGYALSLYACLRLWAARPLAWLLALVGTLTLPAAAFAFQIYPEVAAGIAVFLLVRAAAAPNARGAMAGLGYGLLAGFLPWLHIRFLVAALVLVGALLLAPGSRRSRVWTIVGSGLALALLVLYSYRQTGSLNPMPPYAGDTPLSLTRMLMGVPEFALDREWGVLPHVPLYILSLVGVGIGLRRAPRGAAIVLLVFASVVLPAMGHGFWAGGSTPGRYLVAVLPLLLAFLAEAVIALSSGRMFIALTVALTAASLQTAVRYNLYHVKEIGPIVAKEFSGWRLHAFFPTLGSDIWIAQTPDLVELAVWTVVAIALLAIGWRVALPPREPRAMSSSTESAPRRRWLGDSLVALVVLAALGVIVPFGRLPIGGSYRVSAREARERALMTFAELDHCAVCYSATLGEVPPTVALGNEVGATNLTMEGAAVAGTRARIRVRPRSTTGEFMVTAVRVDFGDGTFAAYSHLFGDVDERHVFTSPGEYTVRAWVKGVSEQSLESSIAIHVAAP